MHGTKKLEFGTAGVRALYYELTPKEAYEITLKIANNYGDKVVIGRDARNNGRALLNAVESALLYLGKSVTNLSITPTPTLQYYLEKHGFSLGIVVTASHNPKEWNGLKFFNEENIGVMKEEGNELLSKNQKIELNPTNNVEFVNANREHAKALSKYEVDAEFLEEVAVDYGNGVAKLVFGEALDLIGAKRREINEIVDGNFPSRPSEPTKENLSSLINYIKEYGLKMGIAFDGDGDRVVFVDEKGGFVDGNKSFAIIAKYLLEKEKSKEEKAKTVISTVASGRVVDDVVKEKGGIIKHVKVGTAYIAKEVKKEKALLGGEEAGGVIYPKEHLGKDGMLTAFLMLEIIKKKNRLLSSLTNELPKYFSYKGKVPIQKEKKKLFMKRFREFIKAQGYDRINEIDGIRVDEKEFWFIVRPSGTEHYIRYFIEAKTPEKVEEIKEKLEKEIREVIKNV